MLLLTATKEQIEIIKSRARYIAGIMGRRTGKTIGIVRNRILSRCLSEKINYTYITPSYPQLEEEYDAISEIDEIQKYIIKKRKQPPPYIRFTSGSRASYRSFERPKNIRGKGEDEIGFDEIQDVDETEFWSIVRPLISDKRGTLSVFGQLRGRNWYWGSFVLPGLACRYIKEFGKPKSPLEVADWGNRVVYGFYPTPVLNPNEFDDTLSALDFKHLDHAAWVTPTVNGLMFKTEDGKRELDLARNDMPRVLFEQEYLCIPAGSISGVFSPEDLHAARQGSITSTPTSGRRYIIGLDLGRTVDHTAYTIVDATDTPIVLNERQFPLGQKHAVNAKEVQRVAARWNNATVIIDTTGGATGGRHSIDEFVKVYTDLMPNARRLLWNRTTKREMIEGAIIALEQRKVLIPGGLKILHSQLGEYTYTARSDNSIDYHAPKGKHDDMVAAFVMCLYGIKRGFVSGNPAVGAVGTVI